MSDNATAHAPLVLLTRPRAASERFAQALIAELGPVAVAIAPLMKIVPTGMRPDLERAAALIFTSAAGVEVFGQLCDRRDLPAWCVGARTAQAARAIGLMAQSADGDAEALVAQLLVQRPKGPLLHLCGTHSRGDVADRLTQAGLMTQAVAIYDQVALSDNPDLAAALAHPGPVIVPLFSPRSAELFMTATGSRGVTPIALSQAVQAALPPDLAARTHVSKTPDAPAMIRAIAAEISRHSTT